MLELKNKLFLFSTIPTTSTTNYFYLGESNVVYKQKCGGGSI